MTDEYSFMRTRMLDFLEEPRVPVLNIVIFGTVLSVAVGVGIFLRTLFIFGGL